MEQYYHILNQWLDIRQNNKGLNQYFKTKRISKNWNIWNERIGTKTLL